MRLRQEFLQPLPGLSAQIHFAPPERRSQLSEMVLPASARQSAVALLMSASSNGLPELLLIKRAEYKGVHSGQIALPGGKMEPDDTTMLDTAMREVNEELGIALQTDQLLGALSPLHIPVSGFTVHPFVFALEQWPQFTPDNKEVSDIILAEADTFFHPENRREVELAERSTVRKVPAFIFEGHVVWGATAMMLSEFSHLYNKISS